MRFDGSEQRGPLRRLTHFASAARYLAMSAFLLLQGRIAYAALPGTAFVSSHVIEALGLIVFVLLLIVASLAFFFNRRLHREVVKRKSIEKEADEAKSRLNAILNNAGVGVLLADGQGRYVDVNRRWCRMFGYRRSEARGKLTTRDITHPDDAAAMGNHFHAMLAGEIKSRTQERRFIRKDGSGFWGLISTSLVKDGAGRSMWVVGMIADIDQQKQVEAKLRESKERLRFITENTHDVVWQLDQELCFIFINGADERMRGYRREELIGCSLSDQITLSGRQILEQATKRQLSSPESRVENFEVEMFRKEGGRIWVEINSTPIRDSSGEITGYIGVARDATQHRERHEKLRQQSIRDPLTGLFNRRYLDDSLERELSRAKRDGLPLSLLMIDIDFFKKLNDTHGHQAGDEVLKRLGQLICNGARSADLPCRYGGEEFLLVLPTMSLESAAERAEHWRLTFANEQIAFAGTLLSATLSVGVAAFPGHGMTADELIRAADQALYAAKNSGRNRVVVAA